MDLGGLIDQLVRIHTTLWHRTSRARLNKDLPSGERVSLFMATRRLNVMRAKARDSINKELKSGYQDPKMSYTGSK